jgi:hypothetical protein
VPVGHAVSQFSAKRVAEAIRLERLQLGDNVMVPEQIVRARRRVVVANQLGNQFAADALYKGIDNRLE